MKVSTQTLSDPRHDRDGTQAHAVTHATRTIGRMGEDENGGLQSKRNLLDASSVAQSLDGSTVWRGVCTSPNAHLPAHPPHNNCGHPLLIGLELTRRRVRIPARPPTPAERKSTRLNSS